MTWSEFHGQREMEMEKERDRQKEAAAQRERLERAELENAGAATVTWPLSAAVRADVADYAIPHSTWRELRERIRTRYAERPRVEFAVVLADMDKLVPPTRAEQVARLRATARRLGAALRDTAAVPLADGLGDVRDEARRLLAQLEALDLESTV